MNTQKLENPRTVGPGTWFSIHTMALNGKRNSFCEMMVMLSDNFRCKECKIHFQKYMKTNPPHKARDMFRWSVDFHNEVNKRLGKPVISLQVAYDYYSDETQLCTECDVETTHKPTYIPSSLLTYHHVVSKNK